MCLRRQGPRCAGWDKSSIFSHVPFFGFLSGLEGVFSCQYIIELSKAGVIFFGVLFTLYLMLKSCVAIPTIISAYFKHEVVLSQRISDNIFA